MKVLFGVPAYKGISSIKFLDSLEGTIKLCQESNIDTMFHMIEGNCYIQAARNDIVKYFMITDCDSLFFLDDDIAWNPENVLELIRMDDEIVAGVYPLKAKVEGYPVVIHTDKDGIPNKREDGGIFAAGLPTGFMRVNRSAIEKLIKAYPQQRYSNYDENGELKEDAYDLFPQGVHNGRWVGEDFAFCRLWTDIGGELIVVPDINFEHGVQNPVKGNYHEFLLRQKGGSREGYDRVSMVI